MREGRHIQSTGTRDCPLDPEGGDVRSEGRKDRCGTALIHTARGLNALLRLLDVDVARHGDTDHRRQVDRKKAMIIHRWYFRGVNFQRSGWLNSWRNRGIGKRQARSVFGATAS